MDPNVAWEELALAIARDDRSEAREYAEALQGWINRGGFYPVGIPEAVVRGRLESVLDPYGDVRDGVK